MTREEKYHDTKTFHYYNANPKERIVDDYCNSTDGCIGNCWTKM